MKKLALRTYKGCTPPKITAIDMKPWVQIITSTLNTYISMQRVSNTGRKKLKLNQTALCGVYSIISLLSSQLYNSAEMEIIMLRSASIVILKTLTERRNWTELKLTELTRFTFWWSDQWTSKASLLVIVWRLSERSHAGHRRR